MVSHKRLVDKELSEIQSTQPVKTVLQSLEKALNMF